MKNSNLPNKLCPVCNRDFTWRKKWIRVWNNVIYCSEKCRRNKSIEWSIGYSHKESKEDTWRSFGICLRKLDSQNSLYAKELFSSVLLWFLIYSLTPTCVIDKVWEQFIYSLIKNIIFNIILIELDLDVWVNVWVKVRGKGLKSEFFLRTSYKYL